MNNKGVKNGGAASRSQYKPLVPRHNKRGPVPSPAAGAKSMSASNKKVRG